MKKILYVTTISGFLPQFGMNDVSVIQGMGYEVHYASNFNNEIYAFDKNSLIRQGVVLHHIDIEKQPSRVGAAIKAVRQIRRIIDKENINIVHCHNPMGSVCARMAAWTSSTKPYVIYTAHGLHFYKGAPLKNWLFFYPVEKLLANLTDMLITINQEDYRCVSEKFRLRKKGYIEQIHGVGVNMRKFSPKPEIKEAVRKELGIPQGALHIVTAAELNDNKNQRVIIEAISEIDDENIYYSICGMGNTKEKLEELIAEKGLTERVRLLGFRTDMDRVLQSADVFAFPSKREGLGIASIEALACGIPIIALNNRGTREYTLDGVNGIMCDSNDVELFRKAIEKMCDAAQRGRYCADSCRTSVELFSNDVVVMSMKSIYEKADTVVRQAETAGKEEM